MFENFCFPKHLTDPLRTLAAQAVKFGKFTLKSGQISDFYFDGKLLSLQQDSLAIIQECVHLFAKNRGYTQFAGVSVGGDPLVAAAVLAVPGAKGVLVRQPKEHGLARALDGPSLAGKVLLLEDVVTTGGSSLRARETLIKEGCVVEDILTIVQRAPWPQVPNLHWTTLLTIEEVLKEARNER